MERQRKLPSAKQTEIADLLFSLTDGPFAPPTPKEKSSYLTLDVGSGPNKNAVTISRHRVSFIVKDFVIEESARSLGSKTKQSRKLNGKREDTRLWFLDLAPSAMLEHPAFFREILGLAYQESKNRQEH